MDWRTFFTPFDWKFGWKDTADLPDSFISCTLRLFAVHLCGTLVCIFAVYQQEGVFHFPPS